MSHKIEKSKTRAVAQLSRYLIFLKKDLGWTGVLLMVGNRTHFKYHHLSSAAATPPKGIKMGLWFIETYI